MLSTLQGPGNMGSNKKSLFPRYSQSSRQLRKGIQEIWHKIVTAIIEVYMGNCVVQKLNLYERGRHVDEKSTPDTVRTVV